MLKFWKRNSKGKPYLYEEKPENKDVSLTGKNISTLLSDSDDIIIRQLYINGNEELAVTFCYVDGLINKKTASDDVLKPLLQEAALSKVQDSRDIINLIEHGSLYYTSQATRDNINDTIKDVLDGSVALIFDDIKQAVTFDIKGFEKRTIQETTGENVIKGSKDAFIEVMSVNTSLVRRKIRTQNLKIKQMSIGQETITPVSVVYIDGIANSNLVDEVNKRLQAINIDGVLRSSAIEEFIVDNKLSAFPQVMYTERPDNFCSNLLEGRVGILIDGLPVSYIVPGSLNQFLHAPEDYSSNFLVASSITFIRFVSVITTLILPGFYISVTTFHQEMIPTELAMSIIISKEGEVFSSTTREIASGLTLNIKGWVSGDGMVTVKVDAQVSKQGTVSSSSKTETTNPPSTSEKKVSTSVRTKNGEPVVIGGLIQKEIDTTEKRVPILGSIPLLGMLFKTKTESIGETEFIIYLVPLVEKNNAEDITVNENLNRLQKKYGNNIE